MSLPVIPHSSLFPESPLFPSGERWIDIPKDGEKRVDWTVQVKHPGEVRIKMTAQSKAASDATEQTFPVLIHGVERTLAQSGVINKDSKDSNGSNISRAELTIDLPQARKVGSSELVVQLNPSLAAVTLDALPYLNEYPYGCIEQTMSRFMPSVIVARTLKQQGYRLEDLRRRAQMLDDEAKKGRDNLKISSSPYTYPKGKPGTEVEPAKRWHDPVFDTKRLNAIVASGMKKIRDYQHRDGGWGWWKDDKSDAYMSAYVLQGLLIAKDAGKAIEPSRIKRGMTFLLKQFKAEEDIHNLASFARVLAMQPEYRNAIRTRTGKLYDKRDRLSVYSKALLAMALNDLGEKQKALVVLHNIENTVHIDKENGTANWGESDKYWWRWYNDQVETNATVLQAFLAVEPNQSLMPMLVKWLVNHRQGDNWSSTHETALAVYALSDYIRQSGELSPNYTLTVELGGKIQRSYKVDKQNALFFDNRFVVPDELLQSGAQSLTITKTGLGSCYYSAYTRFFSQEDSIPASGNEVYVTRKYFRLTPGTASGEPVAKPFDLKRPNPFLTHDYVALAGTGDLVAAQDTDSGPRYERTALISEDTVTSGDLLEVELNLEAKNDYSYLIFEDLKPAGCEPVELRSGEKYGNGLCSNMELRDQKVAFFVTSLPQGSRTIIYRLRAEAPGRFHVLPTNGYAMYAPNIRTLSAESVLSVKEDTEK